MSSLTYRLGMIEFSRPLVFLQRFFHNVPLSLMDVGVTLVVLFVTSKALAYKKKLQAVSYLPGFRIPFYPLSLPGVLLPVLSWNPNLYAAWKWRFNFYKPFGNDTVSMVPYLIGPPAFYTSNIDVARQVASGAHKSSFYKPEGASQAFLLWGMNLVASDGETWRKHRRVVGPAFNNRLYQMVWQETLITFRDMVATEKWEGRKTIDVPVVQLLTFKFALLIIGKCGFGFSFDWNSPPKSEDGSISIQEALRVSTDNYMLRVFAPKWVQNLPTQTMRETKESTEKLSGFMKQQVEERRSELRSDVAGTDTRADVFTMLVKANEDEGGKFKLSDEELIGNIFVMLFAGHETTAHTLAATLGFLAYYENLQKEVYDQIVSVVGLQRDPTIEDYPFLDKVLGAFYESIRMFPAGFILIREAYEDTVLKIPNPVGQEGTTTVAVPKGTQVVVDMIGVQHNPRYFENPEEYRPSRWYGANTSESENFTAFSIGPRACVGRKFASLESVCFLTLLIREYQIVPLLREGETKEAWKNRVLDGKIVLTLGVEDVPVRLVRRR